MSELYQRYKSEIVPALMDRFQYESVMEVPKLVKVTVNMGVGEAVADSKILDNAVKELSMITGQKPVITRARKSISNFKLRKGMAIGCKVTLRGQRMYNFVEKLVRATLPRIRDFNGLSPKGFDGRGNYNLGLSEQLIFPEISYDDIDQVRGMNISFHTSAKTDEEAYELLKSLGLPFRQ
ncbi:MAG TPA: 50S ribosomal protein L5 [Firmicutes bacterium]|nr:50S ribosomal protein L5 [Bacillota bacterium]